MVPRPLTGQRLFLRERPQRNNPTNLIAIPPLYRLAARNTKTNRDVRLQHQFVILSVYLRHPAIHLLSLLPQRDPVYPSSSCVIWLWPPPRHSRPCASPASYRRSRYRAPTESTDLFLSRPPAPP